MLFNSLQYCLFLPAVIGLYYLLPPRRRWALLLAASYYFYMSWKLEYIVLIMASTAVDYLCGLKMGSLSEKRQRKPYLIISLMANLGLLFAFKYFNFANESLRALFDQFNIFYGISAFHVLLPVGISFYTFQTLSYSIEVYRGNQKPERHLGIFALYVSFFPQLVAGPIERSTSLLPQLEKEHRFSYASMTSGLRLILWGMFKKVVIADWCGVLVSAVFNDVHGHDGIRYLLALFFFAYQVYCDFSGYTDIARGSARLFGVELMVNFRLPFYSKTMGEFWKRWHISLTSWFKDYLYIPLGGSRVPMGRWLFNVFVTFLISGLWHGASWNFVIWGAFHGAVLVVEILTMGWRERFWSAIRIKPSNLVFKLWGMLYVQIIWGIAHVFFRTRDLGDAVYMLRHMFDGVPQWLARVLSGDSLVLRQTFRGLGLSERELITLLIAIVFLEMVQYMNRGDDVTAALDRQPRVLRWAAYYVILAFIVFGGAFNQAQQFIYFQF